jgi:Uma2 family endonuclease
MNPMTKLTRARRPAGITADELLRLNIPNKRTELVRGELVVREPAGSQHGYIAMRIGAALFAFVDSHRLGRVYAAETGFVLRRDPDTVRAPDAAFVSSARLPAATARGYLDGAPDLAVEVLSPGDRPGEVLNKVGEWLDAGALLVWVIAPEQRRARVYRADGIESQLLDTDVLEGESVLPGFRQSIAALFE